MKEGGKDSDFMDKSNTNTNNNTNNNSGVKAKSL